MNFKKVFSLLSLIVFAVTLSFANSDFASELKFDDVENYVSVDLMDNVSVDLMDSVFYKKQNKSTIIHKSKILNLNHYNLYKEKVLFDYNSIYLYPQLITDNVITSVRFYSTGGNCKWTEF